MYKGQVWPLGNKPIDISAKTLLGWIIRSLDYIWIVLDSVMWRVLFVWLALIVVLYKHCTSLIIYRSLIFDMVPEPIYWIHRPYWHFWLSCLFCSFSNPIFLVLLSCPSLSKLSWFSVKLHFWLFSETHFHNGKGKKWTDFSQSRGFQLPMWGIGM